MAKLKPCLENGAEKAHFYVSCQSLLFVVDVLTAEMHQRQRSIHLNLRDSAS